MAHPYLAAPPPKSLDRLDFDRALEEAGRGGALGRRRRGDAVRLLRGLRRRGRAAVPGAAAAMAGRRRRAAQPGDHARAGRRAGAAGAAGGGRGLGRRRAGGAGLRRAGGARDARPAAHLPRHHGRAAAPCRAAGWRGGGAEPGPAAAAGSVRRLVLRRSPCHQVLHPGPALQRHRAVRAHRRCRCRPWPAARRGGGRAGGDARALLAPPCRARTGSRVW